MSGDREQVVAETLVRAKAVLNSYEVCGQLWHDLNATLSPAMAALDAAAVSTGQPDGDTGDSERALRQAIEELADEWQRTADECARLAIVHADLSDAGELRTASLVNLKRADDLRAALSTQPDPADHSEVRGE